MPRKPRFEIPGGIYYVTGKALPGRKLFRKGKEVRLFLDLLGKACERTGWHIYAYALTDAQFQILLKTPEPNLITGMVWQQGLYTSRINRKREETGSLFQGRYKTIVLDPDYPEGIQLAAEYIHLSPVRLGLLRIGRKTLSDFEDSSFPALIGKPEKRPRWLIAEELFEAEGLPADGRKAYEIRMEELASSLRNPIRLKEFLKKWKPLERGWFLGTPAFREKLNILIKTKNDAPATQSLPSSHQPMAEVAVSPTEGDHGRQAAETLLQKSSKVLGIDLANLPTKTKGEREKYLLAWVLRTRTTVSRQWIAERLQMGDSSRVTTAVQWVESESHDDKYLSRTISRLARAQAFS